jgi:hypothetical protein
MLELIQFQLCFKFLANFDKALIFLPAGRQVAPLFYQEKSGNSKF